MELRFHEDLYDGFAIDEAVKVYLPFAAIELSRSGATYVVVLTASQETVAQGIAEADIGAELLNFALGKTIQRRGLEGVPGAGAAAGEGP